MAGAAGELQFRGFTSAELATNPLAVREFGVDLTNGRIVLGQGSVTAAIPFARLDEINATIVAWLNALPTSLPGTAGQWWVNGGVLSKS